MDWYRVIKTINGRRYLYLQKTYREGRRVRTLNRYVGPFHGALQPTPFQGFRDLTTNLLSDLRGRSIISKQYLVDATNRPELKQAERDLVRNLLKDEPDSIVAKDFANKVRTELLPLKSNRGGNDYENVVLPDDLRGPVANYEVNVYESPIETSAGDIHFSASDDGLPFKRYFAHTRIEDLPVGETRITGKDLDGNPIYDLADQSDGRGGTRRIIEIQSDLFQKGRLESELGNANRQFLPDELERTAAGIEAIGDDFGEGAQLREVGKIKTPQALARQAELSKLEPYRNTWWERIVREEVKQAAKDGKTKLQFPTGETAMKIEGLGEFTGWVGGMGEDVTPGDLKVGKLINRHEPGDNYNSWVITDVLGDGKFKAVPIDSGDYLVKNDKVVQAGYDDAGNEFDDVIDEINKETFDISGKIDTNNPIYKFYEKDVQKYLTKKYGGKVITDSRGVKWVEINVAKEAAKLPVGAFSQL